MRGLREPVTRHQVDCRADRHFSGRVALTPPPHGALGDTFQHARHEIGCVRAYFGRFRC